MRRLSCVVLSILMLFNLNPCALATNKPVLKVAILELGQLPEYDTSGLRDFDVAIAKEIGLRTEHSVEFINSEDPNEEVLYGNADCTFCYGVTDELGDTLSYMSYDVTVPDNNEMGFKSGSCFLVNSIDMYDLLNNTIISIVEDGTAYRYAKEYNTEGLFMYPDGIKRKREINEESLRNEITEYAFSVEDAWILSDNCVLALMENGELYSGKAIDDQNPKLIAERVADIAIDFVNPFELSSVIAMGQILYYSGEIATIQYEENKHEKNRDEKGSLTIGEPESVDAIKIFPASHIDVNNNLRTKDSIIMENVERNYFSNSENFAITTSGDLYVYNYSEREGWKKELLLNDVEGIFSEQHEEYIILRNSGDLCYLKKGEVPAMVGTNIHSIEDVALSNGKDLYYVDGFGDVYYCDLVAKEMSRRKVCSNIDSIHENMGVVLVLDGNGYRYNVDWRGATGSKYGYKKYLDDNHYEDMDGFLCSNDVKYNIKNVEKVISNGDMKFFITSNDELRAAYECQGNREIEPFLTSFSQKRMKVMINNKEINLEAKIQIVNDRSMYPFRECLENMGATVLWDDVNKIAIGEYNGVTIEFPIGKNEYYVNDKKYTMDIASYVDSGAERTYIPIRYAAEGLGFIVEWKDGLLESSISIHQ